MAALTVATSLLSTYGPRILTYAGQLAEPAVHDWLSSKVNDISNPASKKFVNTILDSGAGMLEDKLNTRGHSKTTKRNKK